MVLGEDGSVTVPEAREILVGFNLSQQCCWSQKTKRAALLKTLCVQLITQRYAASISSGFLSGEHRRFQSHSAFSIHYISSPGWAHNFFGGVLQGRACSAESVWLRCANAGGWKRDLNKSFLCCEPQWNDWKLKPRGCVW